MPDNPEQEKRALATYRDIIVAMGRIDREIIALLNALEKWGDAGPEEKDAAFALVAASARGLHERAGELVETCDGYDAGTQEESGGDD